MTEAPKVEQVDREAAANIWRDYIARTGEVIVERGMRSGGLDDGLPTLLAAHRLTEPERTAKAVVDFRWRAMQCRTNRDAYDAKAAAIWDLAADALEGKR